MARPLLPWVALTAFVAASCELFHDTDWATRCTKDPGAADCPTATTTTSGATGGGGGTTTGAGGGGSGQGGGSSFAVACQALAESLCADLVQCMPVVYESVLGGDASCVARAREQCENALSGGGLAITPAQLEECVDALALGGGSCSAVVRLVAGQQLPDACKVAGTRADGEPCVDGRQCSGRGCRVTSGQTCGVCFTLATAGGACTVDADCDVGTFCAGAVCTTLSAEGEPCGGAGHACFADLFCNAGACATRHTQGQACDAQIASCAADLVCLQQCTAIPIAQPGDPCGQDISGIVVDCGAGSSCRLDAANQTVGTCTAQGVEGGPCPFDLWIGPAGPCPFPSSCIAATCTALEGSACP